MLERLVAGIRERTAARQYRLLAAAPSPHQRLALEELVVVEAGRRVSRLDRLDRLRRSPTDISGAGVVKALDRYAEIDGLGAAGWDLSSVPAGRIAALARFASAARARAVADPRRLATLVAFAATMRPVAADEAIEVFDLVVGDLVRTSGSTSATAGTTSSSPAWKSSTNPPP